MSREDTPRTPTGRALLAAGSFPEDEGPPTWWSPGDLTPDVMRHRILTIEREAFWQGVASVEKVSQPRARSLRGGPR